jgi:hypothetical protein
MCLARGALGPETARSRSPQFKQHHLTIPKEHDAAERHGWKQENYGLFSHHLCPEHRRHNWFQVREQPSDTPLHSTP